MALHQALPFAFGIFGNIISFMVYLAPVPTFYRIYKKKSTEGFQALPYAVALFSAMLMMYYALIKTNSILLITINGFGCLIETIYIVMFLIYATKSAKVFTIKLLLGLNIAAYCVIVVLTFLLSKGSKRVKVVGLINVAFSVCVFAAPLSIMRLVIRTKSVEFMPFSLSFFLTVSAVVWFTYGLLIRDPFIAAPNILGFLFGVAQMVLYLVYKNVKITVSKDTEMAAAGTLEHGRQRDVVIRLSTTAGSEVHPIEPKVISDGGEGVQVQQQDPREGPDRGEDKSVTGAHGEILLNISFA